MLKNHIKRCKTIVILACLIFPAAVYGGPPFNTDDPEPVDYLHWEFYISSAMQFQNNQSSLTLPHFEVNYGALPNLQLHLLAPMGYVHSIDGTKYGYSNTEVGVKYRFIEEKENTPQVGIFPLVEIPTGDKSKELSNGNYQLYLPVWLQKSWGRLTTYGGAGYWINPGLGNKNWVFAGWELQYDLSEAFTLGGEIYYHGRDAEDSKEGTGFSIGGFINPNEINHILFSVGSSSGNGKTITGYIGYQMTI